LRSILGTSQLGIYDMMRYHLGWIDELGESRREPGGKLLRPILCLLACQAVGGEWRQALPTAAAVELVHNFSLLHDDIEDASPERHHRPTVWKVWGQAQAINAGDSMHALARLALFRLEGRGVARERVLRAAHILDETCLQLCEGQYLDIRYEGCLGIGVEDYLRMIGDKTAALIEASLHLGALVGAGDEKATRHLCYFGRNLGLAFQIQDDVLGIWGGEKTTGKPADDIQRRKKTLPVVYGLKAAGAGEREELWRICGQEAMGKEGVTRVLGILNRLGARAYAQGMAEQYYQEAISQLEASNLPSPALEELEEVAASLMKREY
jgi:geranylgeranyl diphosphate synthase type I